MGNLDYFNRKTDKRRPELFFHIRFYLTHPILFKNGNLCDTYKTKRFLQIRRKSKILDIVNVDSESLGIEILLIAAQ